VFVVLGGRRLIGLLIAGVALLAAPGAAGAVSFSNTNAIGPLDGSQQGRAIEVSGVTGPVTKVRVTLVDFEQDSPSDVDALLIGPGGQRGMVLSDSCGGAALNSVTMIFDDSAGATAPGVCADGATYKPTDAAPADMFVGPAPTTGPYPATFAGFIGADPNGIWQLFVVDDNLNADPTSVANGWTLDLDVPPPPIVATPPATPQAATPPAATPRKKCKKGRKLKRGKCVKRKKKKK
jgi:hypothetical protein